MMNKLFCTILILAGLLPAVTRAQTKVILPADAAPRVQYGAQRLTAALKYIHDPAAGGRRIIIDDHSKTDTIKEGFSITKTGNIIHIDASDPSGALYGCLELADRIKRDGWPTTIQVEDHPGMVLRGSCIGVQKPTLLPGRGPYEYPYTPENFPWFYDRKLWIRYLDSMVNNRLNTLYLWNGHPFASLVRLPDYPYAVEVDSATFKKNEEIYRFLTTEADKRGIWVIQLFYNIIVSKPFAEHNHLKTQDRNRHILPLIADYTRKSIAAFVQKYPNVGLMVTLGEAMEGVGQDDIDWFTQTIIPGIKDGLKALGRTDEPPVVLRAHDTDGPAVLKAALPLYKNLYVEAKYNGEALTTYTPHGPWADLHRTLSQSSRGLIENIHIMANLEPFRYGSADFIQKCVQAMHSVYGANSLHLYPQASYWDWPYSADSVSLLTAATGSTSRLSASDVSPRLLEMDRDWIWYAAWARYAWNCNRDRNEEVTYWSTRLGAKFGCDTGLGKDILMAYEQAGEIAPKLLRRFGITDGNRQTLTLGMLMTQLINPDRYGLFTLLYNSEGPPGESLRDYAEISWDHGHHSGETPITVINDVRNEGKKATAYIDAAAAFITKDRQEFIRLQNDMHCYKALADCYASKAEAALDIIRYRYTSDVKDLEKALPLLEASLRSFRELTRLATPAYRYANSMQTQQRKIPIRGAGGKFITWAEMLPVYEHELDRFRFHIDSLKHVDPAKPTSVNVPAPFEPATVQLLSPVFESFAPDSGALINTDTVYNIRFVAAPLRRLKFIRQSYRQQQAQGTHIEFANTEPVDLLIGFINEKSPLYCPTPQLETDASANDYGQAEPRIANGLIINGMPPINVHAWSFSPGKHNLELGKGICMVLGFVKPIGKNLSYDAGLNDPVKKNIDWLFE